MSTAELTKAFGQRVAARRLVLGWTQEQLAEKADMHRPDISAIEHGHQNPTLATIEKLSKALGVSAAYLMR